MAFAIIGFGKLGGLELGPGSDLDIVFLHDLDAQHNRFLHRMVRRLLHILTTRTHTGALYDVDTRLRPSGRAGTMVSSLAAFEQYQQQGRVGLGTSGAGARATGRRRRSGERRVRANPPRDSVSRSRSHRVARRDRRHATPRRRIGERGGGPQARAGRYRGYRVYGPIPRTGRGLRASIARRLDRQRPHPRDGGERWDCSRGRRRRR